MAHYLISDFFLSPEFNCFYDFLVGTYGILIVMMYKEHEGLFTSSLTFLNVVKLFTVASIAGIDKFL